MPKYGFQCKFQAKEGQGSALADVLKDAANVVSSARGCHLYVISKDLLYSDTIWIYEIWDSKLDHENSLVGTDAMELIQKAGPMLAEPPSQRTELDILGGVGVN